MNCLHVKILLFLFLLIVIVSPETCGTVSKDSILCSGKGNCEFQKCSCFSGYAGYDCEYQASTTDCIWNINSLTKTDFYAIPDHSKIFFNNNTIYIAVKAPLVKNRLNTKIYIENDTLEECSYPGNFSMNILESDRPCYNIFNFSIPWELGRRCGWKISEYEEETIYSANMYIEQTELLGPMRGEPLQRFIKRVIPLKLIFKKKICVSTKIAIDSPYVLNTEISRQGYSSDPRKSTGVIEFMSSLVYPINIDPNEIYVVSFPLGVKPHIQEIPNLTTCLNRESCSQKYSILLSVDGACTFSGLYNFKFKFKCNPAMTKDDLCPLGENEKLVDVVLNVNSEDFCSSLKVNVNIQGSLKSYKDNLYSTGKSVFLEDETAFFHVETKSSQASIRETKVIRVQVEQGNLSKVLFDKSNLTLDGEEANFKMEVPPTATTASFYFDLRIYHVDFKPNSTETIKISALLEVRYESPDGSTFYSYSNSSFLNSADIKGTIQNSQMVKYSENIQLFKLYKPKYSGGSFLQFSNLLIFSAILICFL
jgi:hypothetical protein